MKHYISILLAMLALYFPVFAPIQMPSQQEENVCRGLRNFEFTDDYIYVEEDLQTIIKEMVPSNYVSTFNHYTEMGTRQQTMDLRIQLLATGWIESEWKPVTSKPNLNGSYDIGYLQLNSNNLNNDLFLWKFSPRVSDGFDYNSNDNMEIYMIMCIKLYKSLYNKYGDDACYCYNGGEGKYLNDDIPASTYLYQKRLSKTVDDIVTRLENMRHEREEKVIREAIELERRELYRRLIGKYIGEVDDGYTSTKSLKIDKSYIYDDKKRIAVVFDTLNLSRLRINKNYVYVGERKKNTGDIAPVFLYRPTGKLVFC